MISHTFPKEEHLKGSKLIQTLFCNGKAFSVFPFKVYYLPLSADEAQVSLRAGFSIPSRSFKKAVHRNRIKRQMREVYRLQKQELQQILENREGALAVFFIYTGRKLPMHAFLFEKMGLSLSLLIKALQKKAPTDETSE